MASMEQGCIDISIGIGGDLFAIAADKSIEWGYEGAVHGFAANKELLRHYVDVFHAEYLGMLHQYQFFIDEEQAKSLLEVSQAHMSMHHLVM